MYMVITYLLFVQIVLFVLTSGEIDKSIEDPEKLNENNEKKLSCSSDGNSVDDNNEFCTGKRKRYFLYDVNQGEGFNLRRDVYIRIAPLIFILNQIDIQCQWILVLPPWGRLPHWKNQKNYYPWSTFFQIDEIRKYIPAIELKEFIEEFNDNGQIDMVFQLQHFPFDPDDTTWSEKIETGVICEDLFMYNWNEATKYFTGRFWHEKLTATNATCMSLRGQASTLADFLITSNYTSVMFDRAEVILWDNYGGSDWWKARQSLRFSKRLTSIANEYLSQELNQSQLSISPQGIQGIKPEGYKYVGVHLRRQDFVFGRRKLMLPSLPGAAKQGFQIAKRLKFDAVFLATDATNSEFEDFALAFQLLKEDHESSITFLSLHHYNSNHYKKISEITNLLSEGELAVLDQIICTWSNYFIGTPDSTFTLRIFEEREILSFDSDSTFNYLCPDLPNDEELDPDPTDCKQPTKWKIKV